MALTRPCSANRSSFSTGSASNRSIRRLISSNASRNAARLLASSPSTSAGSVMPQWASIGWPGKIGHDSLARSHTVMTKSHLARQHLGVEAGAGQHRSRILERVDPRRLNAHLHESSPGEECPVLSLLEGSGHAPHPQLHASYRGRDLAPHHDVRNGKAATRL